MKRTAGKFVCKAGVSISVPIPTVKSHAAAAQPLGAAGLRSLLYIT